MPFITAKASVLAQRNIRPLSTVVVLPSNMKVLIASIDQILKLTILNITRLPTSIQPADANSNTWVKCSCQTGP